MLHCDSLPTQLFITAKNSGGAGTFQYVLYLRGN